LVKNFGASVHVHLDSHDLVRAVSLDSEIGMGLPNVVAQFKQRPKATVSSIGKGVEIAVQEVWLFGAVRAIGDVLVKDVLVRGDAVRVVLFDLLTFGKMQIAIGTDLVDVAHSNQEVHPLCAGRCGDERTKNCRKDRDQGFDVTFHPK
jgi:hypothetical protein